MGAYKSVNLIIALVWLYFAFAASVLITFPPNSKEIAPDGKAIESKSAVVYSEEERRGKTLFKNNCASCHNKNMVIDMTGPALKGVRERWSEYPSMDLYLWVRNSDKLKSENHPRALKISAEWKNAPMTSMEHLSDDNISDILSFIEK